MITKNRANVILGKIALAGAIVCGVVGSAHAQVKESPVVTDSRIKTFVYSENEVYRLVMHYGFQSHIVFDKNEVIETVSVGDSYAWKVTPVEDRIFVKPLEESSYTNMTVITDKRSYQFDLVSKDPGENVEDALVYMVRFYYPSANFDMPHLAMKGGMQTPPQGVPQMPPKGMQPFTQFQQPPFMGGAPAAPPTQSMTPMQSPQSALNNYPSDDYPSDYPDYKGGMSAYSMPDQNAQNASFDPSSLDGAPAYNFNYTLSGADTISPDRVFDDGMNTYFEFPANVKIPQIVMVMDGDAEVPVNHNMQSGFIVVNGVAEKFSLRSGNDTVYVYNENI